MATHSFEEADRSADAHKVATDRSVLDLVIKQKSVEDRIETVRRRVERNRQEIAGANERIEMEERRVAEEKRSVDSADDDVNAARRRHAQEKEDAVVRQVVVGGVGILATVCTFGLATPVVLATSGTASKPNILTQCIRFT